ncbi:Oligoribonuclease, mitochondrial [Trichinella pseudospiralis]|uniref:Probable oligoribonuclease n=1 Tax=Trichinella pseudospiralis TaxID=6337 RepID=A0A0V1INE3_TRIPS|nr:Oligoribonuclease, mitochondrial [Trichinella pseudospiralis]
MTKNQRCREDCFINFLQIMFKNFINSIMKIEPGMSVQASQKTSRSQTVMTDPKSMRLIWIDCEIVGLDIDNDRLMEIACMVTEGDENLTIGPNIIIHQDDVLLANMNEWCKTQHGKTGLTEAVQQSTVTEKAAEKQMLEFLSLHTPPGLCPLAGNSIGRDRQFIEKYMPNLAKHFHYKSVDVTTIAELCKRWLPDIAANTPAKKEMHRALDDIRESRLQLLYYYDNIFKRNQ